MHMKRSHVIQGVALCAVFAAGLILLSWRSPVPEPPLEEGGDTLAVQPADPAWLAAEQHRLQRVSVCLQSALRTPEGRALPASLPAEEAAPILIRMMMHGNDGLTVEEADAMLAGGRLVDSLGVPLLVHRRASDSLDLISAGLDRQHSTADDVKMEGPPGEADYLLGRFSRELPKR